MMAGHTPNLDIRFFLAIGLVVGSLPQVQPHSIVAAAQWGITFFLLNPIWRRSSRIWPTIANFLILGVVAIALGLPQLKPFMHRLEGNFISLKPIWQGEERPRNFFTLWFYGLGFFWILSICVGPFTLTSQQLRYYIPSLVVYAIANVVWYQPWHLDNTKVFNAGWVPLGLAVVSNVLVKIGWSFSGTQTANVTPAESTPAKTAGHVGRSSKSGHRSQNHQVVKKPIRRDYRPIFIGIVRLVCAALLFLGCTLAGFFGVCHAASYEYPLWWNWPNAYQIANIVKRVSPPRSIWITDSGHTNPIVTLAGRQTLAGYGGWLSSHGLNDEARVNAMKRLTRRPDDVAGVDGYGVEFAAVDFKSNSDAWKFDPKNSTKWKTLFLSEDWGIYQRIK
jgi:hypothetical protein